MDNCDQFGRPPARSPGPPLDTQVRDRLARWRAEHGGRGIRVPEGMWSEVVEVAQVEGVEGCWTPRGWGADDGSRDGGPAEMPAEMQPLDDAVSSGVKKCASIGEPTRLARRSRT